MTIIHPKLTERLTRTTGGFFPATGAVQEKTETNTRGNPTFSWASVSGLDAIRCAIAADIPRADEHRDVSHTYADSTHKALLDDLYTTIASLDHRFLSGGIAYDILGVEHDSQSATTRLFLRQVTV